MRAALCYFLLWTTYLLATSEVKLTGLCTGREVRGCLDRLCPLWVHVIHSGAGFGSHRARISPAATQQLDVQTNKATEQYVFLI